MDVKENITQEAVERKCVKRAAPDHKNISFSIKVAGITVWHNKAESNINYQSAQ